MDTTDLHHDRAMILFQQRRYADAERELRSALARQPHDARLHAVLGMTLAQQDRLPEASAEADQAVGLGPDMAYAHYVRGLVLLRRHRYDEAAQAAAQTVALDPYDADYHWLAGAIAFERRNYPTALAAAEQGLSVDPDHPNSANLRAMALVKLGRRDEAGRAIDAALRKDPENADTHANQGWTLLHQGDHRRAQEHFREALRLEPEHEWARAGIVEAMKAKNVVYRLMLRYFLWMSNLSSGQQWAIILGGWVGNKLLSNVARQNPEAAPFILPIQIAYVAFVLATWLADPLFNLLLRLDRFGRYALTRRQTWASNVLGLLLLAAAAAAVVGVAGPADHDASWYALAGVFALLTLPAAGCFRLAAGWPTTAMIVLTAGLAILGLAAAGLTFVAVAHDDPGLVGTVKALTGAFLLGILLSQFAINYLRGVQPAR